jgi:hypothetical protein
VARIDRRVSPNQLSLWTKAELFCRRPSVTARPPAMTRSACGERGGWIRFVLRIIATMAGLGRGQRTATPCPPRAPSTGQGRSTAVNGGSSTAGPRSRQTALTCEGVRLGRVARAGVEPATFRFSGGRSYQLSYLAGGAGQVGRLLCGDPDGTRTRDLRRDRATR